MSSLRTLRLQLDEGRTFPVEIRKQTTERSPHTGRDLVELHGVTSTADDAVHEVLSRLLGTISDRPVRAEDDSGNFAGRWCVSWNSYAETGGRHSYTLLLREAEELRLEALVVGGLELHPYEYREEVAGDGLIIRAKVEGTEGDVSRLRELFRVQGSFEVVRRGIHDAPREVRLGVGEWSETEDGIKISLVLVDRALDGGARPELASIAEENSRAALGYYVNFVERLADALVEKGVLSRGELDALRAAARDIPGPSRRELWKVVDVDEV